MYTYTDAELAALSAIAEAKGVPGVLIHHDFVPDGAEDDEDIVSVVSRRFSASELAAWIDAPTSATQARNACVQVVLSVDGAPPPLSGRGSIVWLGDLLNGALQAITDASARPLGLYLDEEDVRVLRLGRKTLPVEIAALGLSPAVVTELRQRYPDPGQLRGVKAGEAPPFIVRRPTLDEYASLAKGVKHATLVDLLLECIVEPAPIEARRAIVERFPGLGLAMLPILQSMRAAGAAIEKKDRRSAGPGSAT